MEEATYRKISRRLIPLLFILYVVAYLDRINLSFAAHDMTRELGFSGEVYGLGAGLFFIGYFLFEIPSNLILQRIGARIWIARIMISWGIIASAMTFVQSESGFYLLRFFLGLGEAGFFPGILLYLTYWFPANRRAGTVALFMSATAIAGIIGAPLSGALLGLHGLAGLSGWRWLFLLEGLPAVLLGIVVLVRLPSSPDNVKWLSGREKAWLSEQLELDRATREGKFSRRLRDAIRKPALWALCFVYFSLCLGMYGLALWMPTMVQEISGGSSLVVGILSAIPYLGAAVGMVLVGRHSDRTGERRFHTAIPALAASGCFLICAVTQNGILTFIAIIGALFSIWSMLGPFWGLSTSFLGGAAAAAGIALINSIGNLGGFAGPWLIGLAKDLTGHYSAGFYLIAFFLAAAGCAVIWAGGTVSVSNSSTGYGYEPGG
ncbi:MAG: MFS transporter [Geobacteraceae bacterium]|nr:MFS transporter [Geobacteraceae bacterium]